MNDGAQVSTAALLRAQEGSAPAGTLPKAATGIPGLDEITLGGDVTSKTLRGVSGAGTWPQVFIGGKLIGSADDVQRYFDAANRAI